MLTILAAAEERRRATARHRHPSLRRRRHRHGDPHRRHAPPAVVRQGSRAHLSPPVANADTPRRRVGVMGGTFDPIHHGHLVAASEVQSWFDLDEVVFVPAGEPWQKSDRQVSAAEDRYLMTVIATASNPRFEVSRVDIDRAGPTYTIDTLRELVGGHAGRRPLLHHRRRRDGPDPHVARPRGAVRARALRRLHAARPRAGRRHARGPAGRPHHAGRDPGPGHLVHRVPRPRRAR